MRSLRRLLSSIGLDAFRETLLLSLVLVNAFQMWYTQYRLDSILAVIVLDAESAGHIDKERRQNTRH